jgi:hypothetical protein
MGDFFLMESFIDQGYRERQEQAILNGCRHVLQAMTLADIVSVDNSQQDHAMGIHNGSPMNNSAAPPNGWPRKPNMSCANLTMWQQAVTPSFNSTRTFSCNTNLESGYLLHHLRNASGTICPRKKGPSLNKAISGGNSGKAPGA